MEVFQDYAYYYNSFYQDKDYKAEAEVIDQLLKKCGSRVKKIINLGCGTGRHDIELSKLGYNCKGIDMSPLMIDIAKRNLDAEECLIDFDVADIRNYTDGKIYDAVISMFHVMSYQNRNEDILNTFHTARKLLDTGGYFLFDVWYGPGVLSDKPCVRVKEIEDSENMLIRIATPVMHDKENLVDVNYKVLIINKETSIAKTISETHIMRYFFRPELELLLQETGFALIQNLDCQTLGDTDYNSWTSFFLAKAV